MKRIAAALALVGAVFVVSGCALGQADSVDNIEIDGATVHGRVASNQDFSTVTTAVLVAPAPKVPRFSNFDASTDQALFQCGTLTATSDPRVRNFTAPLGFRIVGNSDTDCAVNKMGLTALRVETEYNVRVCAHDSTMPSSTPTADRDYNCGGVRSFTTLGLN
jgi:hypothetical protein